MKSELKTFRDLKQLGFFLKENRRLQGKKIEDASNTLIIKKDILKKFEEGQIDIINNSYLRGFLNSYIKFLKLDKVCKIELLEEKKVSSLEKSNLQLEISEVKKNKYGSIIILLSISIMGLIYLLWNQKTYFNLYLIGSSIN